MKVALLLPLSGKNAALGQAMLNAAQLAVFDAAGKNFELMPRDTGDSGDSAAKAAQDAVGSGAELLIGPVFANSVTAAAPVAQAADINMLALSTDIGLADNNVFVMGFAPAPQVDRVVSYARAHGARNFAALIPQTPYGGLVREAFEAAVGRVGGVLAAVEEYDPSSGAASAISLLGARRDTIDALFLPEGTPDIDSMTDQLEANGFTGTRIHLLGTGLWDVADLARHAPAATGGWFAAPDPRARQNFLNAYIKTYGAEPPRLATLAYDATALAATLAKRGAGYDLAGLTNANGFAGLDGIFRLTAQGLTERGLAILEVTATGSRLLDPAPTSFTRHGR